MSASAGRVLLIPKGAYNASTTYTVMDSVTYQGNSYVCKQTSTGNVPTNTTYWQILVDNSDLVGDISDLTTEVGNVKQALSNEVSLRAQYGVHNLFETSFTPQIKQGVTFAINSDKTVSISGTNSETWNDVLKIGTVTLPKGDYIITGAPSGAVNDSTYWMEVLKDNSYFGIITDSIPSVSLHLDSDAAIALVVYIKGSYAISGTKVFKPLIKAATDTDPTYQPYAMTNQQLTVNKAEKSDLASISITGTTNNTGSSILSGKYFYLNGTLVRAKVDIANNATLTLNTNYEVVTAGALNEFANALLVSSNDGFATGSLTKVTDTRMILIIQNDNSSTGAKSMRLDLQTDKLRWQIYNNGGWTTIKELTWDA